MAEIRFIHSLKKLEFGEVYNFDDPNFKHAPVFNDTRDSEFLSDIPEEFKKIYNKRVFIPETQDYSKGFVTNEATARLHDDMDEITTKYFRAKWDFYVQEKLNQLQLTSEQLEEAREFHKDQDPITKNRLDFMYTYFDYDNDRARIRDKLAKE